MARGYGRMLGRGMAFFIPVVAESRPKVGNRSANFGPFPCYCGSDNLATSSSFATSPVSTNPNRAYTFFAPSLSGE